MDYQGRKMTSRGSNRSNKRLMDGESNPTSDCQSDHSDLSNSYDFSIQTKSSDKPENLSRDPRHFANDSEEQSLLLQLNHVNNDVNSNSSYHASNLSSPSGTYKRIPKTPKTFPRTKVTPKTSIPQRVALQSLRQHMSFTNGDEEFSSRNSPNLENKAGIEPQMNGATAELPNPNQMVSKLVQLRDDINKVNSMIDMFETMYPNAQVQEQVNRLIKVRNQMQASEVQLKSLYHKMTLAVREETVGAVDGREKPKSDFCVPQQGESENQHPEEELSAMVASVANLQDAFKEREEMQQKLIASQEKLKAIKMKQTLSDEALAEQMRILKKHQHKLPSGAFVPKHDPPTPHSNADSDGISGSPLPAYLLRATHSDGDKDGMIPERLNDNNSVTATQLSDDAVIKDFGSADNCLQGMIGHSVMNQANNSFHDQREKLEFKLKDLMDKKVQMDNLLSELTRLKEQQNLHHHLSAINSNKSHNERKFDSKVNNTMPSINMQQFANEASGGIPTDAQKFMQSVCTQEKLMELHSMKERLAQLKQIVSSYETQNGNIEITEDIEKEADADSLRNMISDPPSDVRKSSICKDSIAFRGQRDWSPEGHSSADEGDHSDSDVVAGASAVDHEDDWADNAEVQLKMRKCQEAKDKLARIQDLMNAVQEAKEGGVVAPILTMQLLKAIDSIEENNAAGSFSATDDGGPSLTDAAQAIGNDSLRVVEECSSNMREQKIQLEKLTTERQKLKYVQEQLINLQKQVPLNNNKHPAAQKESNTSQSSRVESFSNLNFHPNFSSNSEPRDLSLAGHVDARKLRALPNKVPQSSSVMALKEELQKQSDVLNVLLREEKEKQQTFSQNQDNQSLQSTKSLQQYGKTYRVNSATGIVSGAAWSGSTTHDFFDDEGDEQHYDGSQEEPDIYSEGEPMGSQSEHSRQDSRYRATETANGITSSVDNKTATRDRNASGNLWTRPNPLPQNPDRVREENEQPAEHLVSDHIDRNVLPTAPPVPSSFNQEHINSWNQQSAHLLQRIEENINLSQAILRDQHALTAIIQSSQNSGSHGFLPSSVPMDQQMRYNFNQCYNIMYQQQLDIHFMQQQLNQLTRGRSMEQQPSNSATNHNVQSVIEDEHYPSALNNSFQPTPPVCMPPLLNSVPSLLQSNPSALFGTFANNHHVGMTAHLSAETPKTLNNQVAPGSRANNYWDNFRSCSRQNLLSVHKTNQQPGFQAMPSCLLTTQFMPTQHPTSTTMAPIPMDDNLGNARNESYLQVASESAARTNSEQAAGGENLLRVSLKKQKSNKDQKPDLKNICVDNKSGPAVTRQPNDQVTENISQAARPNTQRKPLDHATSQKESAAWARPKAHKTESDSFLEQVYSEAASLISENESRPMYLMELFRELKLISSDDYRQNALYSLHDLSLKSAQANVENSVKSQTSLRNIPDTVNSSSGNYAKLFNKKDIEKALPTKSSRPMVEDEKNARRKQNSNQEFGGLSSQSLRNSDVAGKISQHSKDHAPSSKATENTAGAWSNAGVRSTGAIKKRRICQSNQAGEEKQSELSPAGIEEKVQNIIWKLLPFIRVNIEEECQPKIINSICKLVVTLARETCIECNAVDPPEVLQHQLKRILQDLLYKFNGRRMKECAEELLANLSEALFNDLAYTLLVKRMARPLSSPIATNIKSLLQSINLERNEKEDDIVQHGLVKSGELFLQASQIQENADSFHGGTTYDTSAAGKSLITSLANATAEVDQSVMAQGLASDNSDITNSDVHDSLPDEDSALAQSVYNDAVNDDPILAEVETEPEADINNKDLAEADQSPQPSSGNHHPCIVHAHGEINNASTVDQVEGILGTDAAEDDLGATASAALVRDDESALLNFSSTDHHSVSSHDKVSLVDPSCPSTEHDQSMGCQKETGNNSSD